MYVIKSVLTKQYKILPQNPSIINTDLEGLRFFLEKSPDTSFYFEGNEWMDLAWNGVDKGDVLSLDGSLFSFGI